MRGSLSSGACENSKNQDCPTDDDRDPKGNRAVLLKCRVILHDSGVGASCEDDDHDDRTDDDRDETGLGVRDVLLNCRVLLHASHYTGRFQVVQPHSKKSFVVLSACEISTYDISKFFGFDLDDLDLRCIIGA